MGPLTKAKILETEFSEQFIELMRNRVAMSYFKYGPIKINFGERLGSAIKSVKMCMDKYERTGNTEYLIDAANYLMFEFMFPQHEEAHFKATESKDSAGWAGIGINEMINKRG